MRVVVLGAGFGGLEIASRLSERFGDDIDVVVVDRREGFTFGFSKLDVMFGRAAAESVVHPYRDIAKPGVRFVQATVDSIDPAAKCVETSAEVLEADALVLALGADLFPEATPGLVEDGYEFYTEAGALAARSALESFGGGRVVIAVTSTPFKCPPAPSEAALLMHDYLSRREIRFDISLVMPLPVPIPPSPAASSALLGAFAERGINWCPNLLVTSLDPVRHVALTAVGAGIPYDLFLGVPQHRAPSVVSSAGLTVDGWVPVNPLTLETVFPGVYAIGDVTSVGTPKAGVFAEGQAAVVADRISALQAGEVPSAEYGGRGVCYVEYGGDAIGRVAVTFRAGQSPFGEFDPPSLELRAEKTRFAADRVRRWFGRDWATAGERPVR